MSQNIENGTVGGSFESFLKGQGTFEKTTEVAAKRIKAFQDTKNLKPESTSKD